MTSVDVPATLRAIRSSLDLTQAELAEKLGVSFATVNRWEGGGNKPQKAPMERILEVASEDVATRVKGLMPRIMDSFQLYLRALTVDEEEEQFDNVDLMRATAGGALAGTALAPLAVLAASRSDAAWWVAAAAYVPVVVAVLWLGSGVPGIAEPKDSGSGSAEEGRR